VTDSVLKVVKCADCSALLDDVSLPCPNCGSTARVFHAELTGTLELTSELVAKGYAAGTRKPFFEVKTGDSFFRKAQVWVRRMMRIDRRNKRYMEHVVCPRTGETIHYCDEPLEKHKGHGSARKKSDL